MKGQETWTAAGFSLVAINALLRLCSGDRRIIESLGWNWGKWNMMWLPPAQFIEHNAGSLFRESVTSKHLASTESHSGPGAPRSERGSSHQQAGSTFRRLFLWWAEAYLPDTATHCSQKCPSILHRIHTPPFPLSLLFSTRRSPHSLKMSSYDVFCSLQSFLNKYHIYKKTICGLIYQQTPDGHCGLTLWSTKIVLDADNRASPTPTHSKRGSLSVWYFLSYRTLGVTEEIFVWPRPYQGGHLWPQFLEKGLRQFFPLISNQMWQQLPHPFPVLLVAPLFSQSASSWS